MFDTRIFVRFTRIDTYLPVLILIFPLIFLISPENLLSYRTVVIFFANLFLTAFGYTFNDVEDAEDDYLDVEKRKRNPIASGELTKKKGYLISFLLLSVGLFLLIFIGPTVLLLGLIFALVGFSYSWKSLRLKSVPVIDMITHAVFLGVLQFLMTYLTFRSLDLFVVPFLMIIVPFSFINEILGELEDFDVDKKTNIKNTIQKIEKFDMKKLLITLGVIVITGFSIIILTIAQKYNIINLSISTFIAIIAILKMNTLLNSCITHAGKLHNFREQPPD